MTFVYAAARETDARTGSHFAPAILAEVERRSPVTALSWSLAELSAQVSSMLCLFAPRHVE